MLCRNFILPCWKITMDFFVRCPTSLCNQPNFFKKYIFHISKPCSHASSFLRLCYAIGVFFRCFLRLMTWGKRRFSNRSTPDNARFVRRAPGGYFRIFTALHRSCSQLHVALLAARHITASGLLRLLRLGMENELYEFHFPILSFPRRSQR